MKLLDVVFYFKIDSNTQIYNSTHFYINVLKNKLLYMQLIFNQNQFYIINSPKSFFGESKPNILMSIHTLLHFKPNMISFIRHYLFSSIVSHCSVHDLFSSNSMLLSHFFNFFIFV